MYVCINLSVCMFLSFYLPTNISICILTSVSVLFLSVFFYVCMYVCMCRRIPEDWQMTPVQWSPYNVTMIRCWEPTRWGRTHTYIHTCIYIYILKVLMFWCNDDDGDGDNRMEESYPGILKQVIWLCICMYACMTLSLYMYVYMYVLITKYCTHIYMSVCLSAYMYVCILIDLNFVCIYGLVVL